MNESDLRKKKESDPEVQQQEAPAAGRSRLARAMRAMRAEAARALKNEPVPRYFAPSPVPDTAPGPFLQDGLELQEWRSLCEVEDGRGRLLVCMKPKFALRQKLPLRLAACVPRTTRGTRVLLHKSRAPQARYPGLWDIPLGWIRPGEAGVERALCLLEEAGLEGPLPRLVADTQSGNGLPGPLLLYTADLPSGLYPTMADSDFLELDVDELAALAERTPELLTPEALWAAHSGALFRGAFYQLM
ncbi:NUDIX hydrolase [Desulfovibrio sp. OttesenSCG-928-M16]|nr:NUDIX hydrolase [Desulfovibrio sp. OttesenSCG-928-M16]